MEAITVKEAARAMGAVTSLGGSITQVCTDTRKIIGGCLFFALVGENFDGHDFAVKAVEGGAEAVVCQRDCGLGERQLLVKSTRQALLDLAGYYRSKFDIPVVGITGSVGKTTTKDMTHVVLSEKYKTLKNEGNLNNEIGVPLTLFRLDGSYEAAVIEMGMSGFGEISRMTAAVKPDVAIISNIGVSHIEKLGSRENILKAKLEIVEGMRGDAPLILNADDDLLCGAKSEPHPIIYFGIDSEKSGVRAFDIVCGQTETLFTLSLADGERRVKLPSSGKHNVYNALAAVSAGLALGIEPQAAVNALVNYTPSGMRQRITSKAGITVIEDCYNASPVSQKAALEVLRGLNAKRRLAVLGDMKELGEISAQAHRAVGADAAKNGVDILLTYGEMSRLTAEEGARQGIGLCRSFDSKEELSQLLISLAESGDAVLFKASRAMKLEDVIHALYAALEETGKD